MNLISRIVSSSHLKCDEKAAPRSQLIYDGYEFFRKIELSARATMTVTFELSRIIILRKQELKIFGDGFMLPTRLKRSQPARKVCIEDIG